MIDETIKRTREELVKRGIPRHKIQNMQKTRRNCREDFFGFGDLGYLRPENSGQMSFVVIQACWAGADFQKHLQKFRGNPEIFDNLQSWLLTNNKFEFWAWNRKKKVRGGTYYTHEVNIIEITSCAQLEELLWPENQR